MFVAAINILITFLKISVLLIVTAQIISYITDARLENEELTNDTDESSSWLMYYPNTNTESTSDAIIFGEMFYYYGKIVFGSVAFLGNIFTVCVVLVTEELRKKRCNYQIINLAIKDAIIGAMNIVTLRTFFLSDMVYHTYVFQAEFILYFSSSITILSVAIERGFAVIAPFQYTRYLTKKALVVVIVVDWFIYLSLLIALKLQVFWDIGFIYIAIPGLSAPVVTFLLYLTMIYALRRSASKINQSMNVPQRNIRIRQNINMIAAFAWISGIFFVCYFPFSVILFTYITKSQYSYLENVVDFLFPFLPLNSAVNIFIYWWRIPEFRMACMRILCCQRNTHVPRRNVMKP